MNDLDLPANAPQVTLQAGDYFVRQWTLTSRRTAAPVELAGYALSAVWRDGESPEVPLLASSPAAGVLRVEGTAANVAAMSDRGRIYVRGLREGKPQTFLKPAVRVEGDGTVRRG